MKNIIFIIACIVCSVISVAANAVGTCQDLLIPSYIYPGTLWTQMERTHSPKEIVIINPNSGPGSQQNSSYVAEITRAHNAGLTVLGYVYTGYGVRAATDVDYDVAQYAKWYDIDGIFYDEVSAQAGDLDYYQKRLNYLYGIPNSIPQAVIPQAVTVLNPGVVPDRGYADLNVGAGGQLTLVTFENRYNVYVNLSNKSTPWVNNYPASRFAHLVYGATSSTQMLNAVKKSKSLNAGYIMVSERTVLPWNYLSKYNSALVTATSCF